MDDGLKDLDGIGEDVSDFGELIGAIVIALLGGACGSIITYCLVTMP